MPEIFSIFALRAKIQTTSDIRIHIRRGNGTAFAPISRAAAMALTENCGLKTSLKDFTIPWGYFDEELKNILFMRGGMEKLS